MVYQATGLLGLYQYTHDPARSDRAGLVLSTDSRRPFDAALEGMAQVRSHLKGPVYGVLGNHDTIRMVPGLEEMGIRMLLNECETIVRDNERIHLAGIDDAHYHRVDNIEKGCLRDSAW